MVSAKLQNDRGDLMASVDDPGSIFIEFASILNYPNPDLEDSISKCCDQLNQDQLFDITKPLQQFQLFVQGSSLAQLEELYTELFDTNPAFCLYVGYHLFGDGYERSRFLQELTRRFRSTGFTVEGELPDHLTVILRFLGQNNKTSLANELIQDAIVPTLEKITQMPEDIAKKSLSDRFKTTYSLVLTALVLLLKRLFPQQQLVQDGLDNG
ncbi:MAG: nitrate reductase molybdenum cofactor assembly chaperone [Candidatus Heimdallarchaeota archaeon]